MCTVTFIPGDEGFGLGMNRDEKRDRVVGLPPGIVVSGGKRMIMPTEPSGGTWVGVHEDGHVLALINWYAVPRRVLGLSHSRGQVLRDMLGSKDAGRAVKRLREMSLSHVNPFRIIGIFPETRTVREWGWDLERLAEREEEWSGPETWISSGHDEWNAEIHRRAEFDCQIATMGWKGAGGSDWLQRLHSGHGKQKGAFSHCMHREDAVTVSYTEVKVGRETVEMRYRPGSPCEGAAEYRVGIARTKG